MTGTPGSRRVMARDATFHGLMTWGSSSMAGGWATADSPLPHNILDHLHEAIFPLPLTPTAIGGVQSRHNRVQMGLDTPTIRFSGGRAETGSTVPVAAILDEDTGRPHSMSPWAGFTCRGTIHGTPGTLQGTGSGFSWTPDDWIARVSDGPFVSAHLATIRTGDGAGRPRHLIWSGKNNIWVAGGQEVIDDIDAMVRHVGGPTAVIVIGQWVTPADGAAQIVGCSAVNDAGRARYGHHFLDLHRLLTTAEGLTSPPVQGLGLWGRASVRDAAAQGRTPSEIVGADRTHLTGFGNMIVTWALLEKMKELEWI